MRPVKERISCTRKRESTPGTPVGVRRRTASPLRAPRQPGRGWTPDPRVWLRLCRAGGMWPTSIGGTFTPARILGTVPVEPDGSACFDIPAMRPLLFVALDSDRLSVKRIHSFLSVMPRETAVEGYPSAACGKISIHRRKCSPDLVSGVCSSKTKRFPAVFRPFCQVGLIDPAIRALCACLTWGSRLWHTLSLD